MTAIRRKRAATLAARSNEEYEHRPLETAMDERGEYHELIEYLRAEGLTAVQTDSVLARVRQYDVETQRDSIMDAIGKGMIDLAALIKEAKSADD
jgi:hypothetical protein